MATSATSQLVSEQTAVILTKVGQITTSTVIRTIAITKTKLDTAITSPARSLFKKLREQFTVHSTRLFFTIM